MSEAEESQAPAEPAATDVPGESQAAPPIDFETLQRDLERFRDLAQRSQADLDNYRKRMAREREDAIRYANGKLLEELLPILDSFELGLEAASKTEEGRNLAQGFGMVQKLLVDFLGRNGVEPVDAVGAEFDPNLHEAVGQEASEEVPEGIVVRQLRKGYKLKDRLLRPASVLVSKGPATGE